MVINAPPTVVADVFDFVSDQAVAIHVAEATSPCRK